MTHRTMCEFRGEPRCAKSSVWPCGLTLPVVHRFVAALPRVTCRALQWTHAHPGAPCDPSQCRAPLRRRRPGLATGSPGYRPRSPPGAGRGRAPDRPGGVRRHDRRSSGRLDPHADRSLHSRAGLRQGCRRPLGAYRSGHRPGGRGRPLRSSMPALGRQSQRPVRRPDDIREPPGTGAEATAGGYNPI